MSTPPAGATRLTTSAGAPAGDASPEQLALRVHDAVLAMPQVAGLDGGPFGTVATYLPGRRVEGVAVRDDGSTEVWVVARAAAGTATDLRDVASDVNGVVRALVQGPVRVTIADVAL